MLTWKRLYDEHGKIFYESLSGLITLKTVKSSDRHGVEILWQVTVGKKVLLTCHPMLKDAKEEAEYYVKKKLTE